MKFQSQKIAYWFFATCMLLLSLQLVYGFIMGFAHMGYDNLHSIIPFNTARASHTNLLVMWLLAGFMGAADGSTACLPRADCAVYLREPDGRCDSDAAAPPRSTHRIDASPHGHASMPRLGPAYGPSTGLALAGGDTAPCWRPKI